MGVEEVDQRSTLLFGVAHEVAQEAARMTALRDRLHGLLAAAIPGLRLNGHPTERLPNTLNLSFPAVAGWQLLAAAPSVAASTGSACHAGEHAVSGVLAAMGLTREAAAGAVRLSLGRFTTEAEVLSAAAAVASLRFQKASRILSVKPVPTRPA